MITICNHITTDSDRTLPPAKIKVPVFSRKVLNSYEFNTFLENTGTLIFAGGSVLSLSVVMWLHMVIMRILIREHLFRGRGRALAVLSNAAVGKGTTTQYYV